MTQLTGEAENTTNRFPVRLVFGLSVIVIASVAILAGMGVLPLAVSVATLALVLSAATIALLVRGNIPTGQDWSTVTPAPAFSIYHLVEASGGLVLQLPPDKQILRVGRDDSRSVLGPRSKIFPDVTEEDWRLVNAGSHLRATTDKLSSGGKLDWRIVPLPRQNNNADAGRFILALPVDTDVVTEQTQRAMPIGNVSDVAEAYSRIMKTVNKAPLGLATVERDGTIRDANKAFATMIGDDVFEGHNLLEYVHVDDRKRVLHRVTSTLVNDEDNDPLEVKLGPGRRMHGKFYFSRLGEGDHAIILTYLIDATAQQELELQFAQSQKMQAVGQLAGGVAHDFNNLLTAIIGFSDLLLQRHPAGDPSFADIMQIQQNANRAANLTRQLLAFSRKQTLQPKVLSVTEVLSDITNLIRRLLGDKVELEINLHRGTGRIKADAGQIEQVIVNLAVNARDAMPDGGVVTISTRPVTFEAGRMIRQQPAPAGNYVEFMVADTGVGIPDEDLDKIFEPFYTTKTVGQGTGLGLSTVDGIISQSGGFIDVASETGHGTRFMFYLPEVSLDDLDQTVVGDDKTQAERDLTGKEIILLVEDEDAVRMFASRALTNKGYEVLTADDGEMALSVLAEQKHPVSLIISDVMMPNMDGPTMMAEVIKTHPDIKVLFISGYADEAFRKGIDPAINYDFLAKPFSLTDLAEKVRDVLETS